MINQEYRLKSDWRPVGTSKSSKDLAEWMNMVSTQFNAGEVVSGGTVKPSPWGLRIEAEGDDAEPVNLGLFINTDLGVSIYGGSLWRYDSGSATPIRAGLTDGVDGFYTADDGSVEVIALGSFAASTTRYIYVRQTSIGGVPVETGGYLTASAAASEPTYNSNLFLVGVVVFDADSRATLYNALDGDLHFNAGGDTPDELSIDRNGSGDDEALQIFNWDDAGNTATMQDLDLFPLQADGGGRALDYVSAYSLAEYIAGAIDWSEHFDLDEHSLDYTTTPKRAQLAGWETAVSNVGAPLALSLVPIKEWDGAAFDDVLAYYTIDELLANSSAWLRDGTSATNYGSSIGSAAGVTEIDLAGKSLTGDWATDGNFNLSGAGKVYKAQGNAGVTGDGFIGGIKTDATAMDAHVTALAQTAFLNLSTGGF